MQPAGDWQQSVPAPQDAPLLQEHAPATQFSPIPHAVPLHEHMPVEHVPMVPHVGFVVQPHIFCVNGPAPHDKAPLQSLPQPPQLNPFVFTASSQPSSLVPTAGVVQLAKPKSHVDVHIEPVHTRDAVFVPKHVRPQAPQLKTLSSVTVSHPSSAMGAAGLIQSPNPSTHVGAQTPFVQAVLTEFAPEHT